MSSVTDLIAAQKYKYGEPSGARVDREPIKMLQQSQANLRRGELQEGKQALQSKQLELKAQQFAQDSAIKQAALASTMADLQQKQYKQEVVGSILKKSGLLPMNDNEKLSSRKGYLDAIGSGGDNSKFMTDAGKIGDLTLKKTGAEKDEGGRLQNKYKISMDAYKPNQPVDQNQVQGLAQSMAENEMGDSVAELDVNKYLTEAQKVLSPSGDGFGGLNSAEATVLSEYLGLPASVFDKSAEVETALYSELKKVDLTKMTDKERVASSKRLKQQFPRHVKTIEDFHDTTGADIRGATKLETEKRQQEKQAQKEIENLGLSDVNEKDLDRLSPVARAYIEKRAETTIEDGEKIYNIESLGIFKEKEKAKREVERKFKAQAQIDNVSVIESDVSSLFEVYDSIPKNLLGPIQGRIGGTFEKLAQNEPSIAAYEDLKQTILSNVSRQIGGEKGVLTDKDVERIAGFFPKISDSDSVAKQKLAFVKDFIARRITEFRGRIEKDVEFKNALSNIDNLEQEEKFSSYSDEELDRIANE